MFELVLCRETLANRLWAMRNIMTALALLLCLSNMPALAQSIFTTQIGNRPAVVVSGEIAANAAEVFQAAAGQVQAPLIFLSSPGDSFGNWPLYPNVSTGNRGGRTAESLLCLRADLAGWGQALHGSECPHWISRRLPDEKRPRRGKRRRKCNDRFLFGQFGASGAGGCVCHLAWARRGAGADYG
jgi:hypothetical protein